ncbi:MAG: type IV pilus assembly protein PilO [Phormidesmis priestleyi Ana]|uniref:Type IV pilus assembly protein PilO n=1 Tax=Phormidesmis priestleyi Ana TaxID=1666911 RepID=A0A0P7Z1J3_9CYAN|nr:MAG: type IV pilus assembly protein PilO [Phormidesmis priestleyi Ana]
MAAVGDFIPPDDADFIDEPSNPVVFGIELSPPIIGGIIAAIGIGAAIYGFIKFVKPVQVRNTELQQEITTKEGQLSSQQQQLQDIAKIEAELETAMQRRRNVYGLFANEKTMDTLLLDINQRIESNNASLIGVRNQVFERGIPPILVEAKLESFIPGEKAEVIDSSLGEQVNGKLKRETYSVRFSGDYAQTQAVLRNLERLEPLLLVRDFSIVSGQNVEETVIGDNGQVVSRPKTPITTSFNIEALMPTANADVPPEIAPPAEGVPAEGAPAEGAPPEGG